MKPRSGPPMPSFARPIGACVLAAVALARRRLRQGGAEGGRVRARRGDGADGRAAGRAGHRDLRRADAELAGGQHPGARVGLPRQARLHRRRGRQGGPGAVPDGPEAVPGAGRRRRPPRCSATRRRSRSRRPNLARTKPLAAAERAVAEGPRRRAGPVRAGGRPRSRSRKAQLEAAKLNLSYTTITSPVDGVSAASPRWPTAPTSTRRTRS